MCSLTKEKVLRQVKACLRNLKAKRMNPFIVISIIFDNIKQLHNQYIFSKLNMTLNMHNNACQDCKFLGIIVRMFFLKQVFTVKENGLIWLTLFLLDIKKIKKQQMYSK